MATTHAPPRPRSSTATARTQRAPTRNRGRIALGSFLIATLSFAFAVLYSNVGDRNAVLAIARNVRAGAVLTSADLVEVRISADSALHPVAATDRGSVVGELAGVDLVPGTLLTRRHLATSARIEPGRAVVGLALKAGQFPTELRVGDQVLVVITAPPASSAGDAEATTIAGGRVTSITPAMDGSTPTAVSLEIEANDASAIAAAGGRVSLVRVGSTP
jgi:hypothetical protein